MDDIARLIAERDRLAERLASALTRNESLIDQREMEIATNTRSRHDAAFGRALLAVNGLVFAAASGLRACSSTFAPIVRFANQ